MRQLPGKAMRGGRGSGRASYSEGLSIDGDARAAGNASPASMDSPTCEQHRAAEPVIVGEPVAQSVRD